MCELKLHHRVFYYYAFFHGKLGSLALIATLGTGVQNDYSFENANKYFTVK